MTDEDFKKTMIHLVGISCIMATVLLFLGIILMIFY